MSNFISIQLDNPSKSYYPGSNVTGKVVVFLTKPKKVKNITLYAFGQAKTSFHYQSVLPCGSEKIFLEHYFILLKSTNGDSELIPAGKHYFKFAFQIPSDCLPNFEGEYGNIRYSIKAKIDISLQFNLKDEQVFFVKSVLPTTVAQKLVKQNFTHKFSASEVINVEVILPKEHFAFGETVQLVANIENQSNATIDSIETGIQTTIRYKGKATDSWRGKYFEATEIDNIDSLARKNKLYVSRSQKYCFKRNFELEKVYPSIFDNLINVKHWIFLKFGSKNGSKTFGVTFVVPIKIYSDLHKNELLLKATVFGQNKNPNLPLKNPEIPKVLTTSNIFSAMPKDAPPAYSEIYDLKLLCITAEHNLSPPKYEKCVVQKF